MNENVIICHIICVDFIKELSNLFKKKNHINEVFMKCFTRKIKF